jgi:hypothetical protein
MLCRSTLEKPLVRKLVAVTFNMNAQFAGVLTAGGEMKRNKLVIHSTRVGLQNIRTWEPDDPGAVDAFVTLWIGWRHGKEADCFTFRVATPKGLLKIDCRESLVVSGRFLVMTRYDFDALWQWIHRTVSQCERDGWLESVECLQRYFVWEYENYQTKRYYKDS